MKLDKDKVFSILNIGEDSAMSNVYNTIEPYLPVIQRLGASKVDSFLNNLANRDWDRIDRELYADMTEIERDKLGSAILADARVAVNRAYFDRQQWIRDLLRVVVGVLLSSV